MKSIEKMVSKPQHPVKILQYGEGNFLRAFVEYMIDIANEKEVFNGSIKIVKPIAYGSLEALRAQNCMYTVLLRGKQDGVNQAEKRIITCVDSVADVHEDYEEYAAMAVNPQLRFIVSNTTEAGIVYDDSDDISLKPPKTYPGKLTKLIYDRFVGLSGAKDKGLIILPVELIEKNGDMLKACCLKLVELWNLPQEFKDWLIECNTFCNTLVDRIVTGYPKDEAEEIEAGFGYADKMLVTGEIFGLWVIESDNPEAIEAEFPLNRAGLPVIFTKDLQPYRERKVRILNGAHTATVSAAYLSGLNTVGEMMKDKTLRALLEKAVNDELSPMVPLPSDEVKQFADSVMERFENKFIRHNLLSITLNSVSKFKARILPTIKETYAKNGSLPRLLCFSLAALATLYSGEPDADGKFKGVRGDDIYEIMDNKEVIAFFTDNKNLPTDQFAELFLSRNDFWGEDLNEMPGMAALVAEHLRSIRELGMRVAVENILK